MVRALAPVSLVVAASACSLLNRAEVRSLGVFAQKPANVAAFLAVDDGDEPVTDLEAHQFRIYENDVLLPPERSAQLLLDRDLVAAHRLLLLVDLSTAESAEREALIKGLGNFVAGAGRHQPISVLAFDGGPKPIAIAHFERGATDTASLANIRNFPRRSKQRNLNVAVIDAVQELEALLAAEKKPIRVGTLLVFTRGPDLAGRVGETELRAALEKLDHDLFLVLVGAETTGTLDALLGEQGLIRAQSADTVPIAFEEAAMAVNTAHERRYLLAYCSPSRSAHTRLRVEVEFGDREGTTKSGEIHAEFDASGFGPGCDPTATPRVLVAPASTSEVEP